MNILKNKYFYGFVAALPLMVLAGCADDSSDSDPKDTESEYAELTQAYPGARVKLGSMGGMSPTMIVGQEEGIPTTAAAVFHFDRRVKGLDPLKHIRFVWKKEVVSDSGTRYKEDVPIEFHTEFRRGGRTLAIVPDEELVPFREYEVYVPLKRDPEILPEYQDTHFGRYYTSSFTTGPRWEGTPEETSLATAYFRNVDLIPYMNWYNHDITSAHDYPVFPHSSLTMEFNQPVDPSTVHYGSEAGDNIRLVQRGTGEPLNMDVDVIVSGRYLTLDPAEDLPEGGEVLIDLLDEADPDAIQSRTGILLQPSFNGRLAFGITGEPGVDYELLEDWPTNVLLSPQNDPSDFTVTRANSVLTSGGDVLSLSDADLSVEMSSVPPNMGRVDRTFFTLKASDRGMGERRLAILSDAYGYIYWWGLDRFADKHAYNQITFFADIGILDENGNIESSGRAQFHGEAHGDPREGNMLLDMVSATDPAAFDQERLPGNGLIQLKLKMSGTATP